MNKIAWRFWSKTAPVWYVDSLPGHGGADWGYTDKAVKALPLSPYWQRRFAADCRRVAQVDPVMSLEPRVARRLAWPGGSRPERHAGG